MPELEEVAICALIDSFAGKRVLVFGDLMLDEYLIGDVKRISPEAPVPIVDITHRAHIPGGAANVAANIASLGGSPMLVGIVGEDESGSLLRSQLEMQGVSTEHLVVAKERPTITKTRIVSGQQQIARLDQESKSPIDEETLERAVRNFSDALHEADACILSDYAKGLLTVGVCGRLIALSQEQSKPLVVDPKSGDFRKYAGCTVITPNLREAEIAGGVSAEFDNDLQQIASTINQLLGRDSAVLITRGPDGMTLFRSEEAPIHVPALAHEVFDVTGAGDTVGGALSLSLAAGASLSQAMLISNLAASVVVQKTGTATVSAEELRNACRNYAASVPASPGKGRTYSSLSGRVRLDR